MKITSVLKESFEVATVNINCIVVVLSNNKSKR